MRIADERADVREVTWDTAEYFNAGSGLTRASTTWLLEQGVKVIGTDRDYCQIEKLHTLGALPAAIVE